MARNAIKSYLRTSKMATSGHFVKNSKNKIKFRMDLKWPEMPSKVNFGHPKLPINLKCPEMRSKVIFRHPKWPPKKKKFSIDLKWPELRSKVNFGNPKWPIDLKWQEMRSKVNFGHPKWPTSAILSKISKKIKVAYRSEMARNAIESEIWISKMADVSHFVKNFQKK